MDIRQLRYFVTIVDLGSLSKAAQQLYVAQPALSQQMAGLEAELNVKLLVRSRLGVTPTEPGTALYRHARSVLRQLEQARKDVMQGSAGEYGTVSVGLPTTLATTLAMPLLKRLRAEHPGLHLQLFESLSGYLSELLANGRLDIALLYRDTESRGVSIQPLFHQDLYLIGNVGLEDKPVADTCPVRYLDGVPLVLPSGTQGLRVLLDRAFANAGVAPNVIADIDSLPMLIRAAREDIACTILPRSALNLLNREEWPALRRLVEPDLQRPVSLCWPNALPRTSAVLTVHKIIEELVAQHVHDESLSEI